MLPGFFLSTYDNLSLFQAGLIGGVFAMTNIIARPLGGYLSDKFGRKKALTTSLIGSALGFVFLSQINATYSLWFSIVLVMLCSFFVQAGEGVVFSIVPLIKKSITGQVSGMTGAYGNVGGVTFLIMFTFVDASTFFFIIAISLALAAFIAYLSFKPISENDIDETDFDFIHGVGISKTILLKS